MVFSPEQLVEWLDYLPEFPELSSPEVEVYFGLVDLSDCRLNPVQMSAPLWGTQRARIASAPITLAQNAAWCAVARFCARHGFPEPAALNERVLCAPNLSIGAV